MDAARAAEFVAKIAGYTTYGEAIEEADTDPDVEVLVREDFMTGLDDDWDAIITEARRIAAS